MSSAAYTSELDEISLGYSDDDYKVDRPEPRLDVYFEWRITNTEIKRAKSGRHLTLVIKAEALDGTGRTMFPKWINVAIPVSIPREDIECPDYSKKMFLDTLRPFFPEMGPYDRVDSDGQGRRVYYKDGQVLAGRDFDVAKMEANRRIGALAKEFARTWLDVGDKASVDILLEKTFFGILKASKNGQYVNIARISSVPPINASVVYDRKEAYSAP